MILNFSLIDAVRKEANMTINEIVEMIENEYGETCAEAEIFRESGEMWNYCMEVVKDHNKLNCIIFANDMGIPPIKSFLEFYELFSEGNEYSDKKKELFINDYWDINCVMSPAQIRSIYFENKKRIYKRLGF